MSHNPRTGQIIDGLPVFDPDNVVWDAAKLPTLQHYREDTAIRLTLTDVCQPYGSVMELVKSADNLFTRFASMCGATLIEHDWGFAKLPDISRLLIDPVLSQHPLYPSGYTLVARVEIIRGVYKIMPELSQNAISTGHNNALAKGLVGGMEIPDVKTEEPVRLSDYPIERRKKLPRDFAYGRRGNGFSNPSELYFVDLEPYVFSNDPTFELPYEPLASGSDLNYLRF